MTLSEEIRKITERQRDPGDPLALIEEELSSALSLYWTTAAGILEGGPIRLLDQPEDYLSLEGNFFSALFLYSYHRAGIPKSRRILYTAVNQCLRGMVTGCDNLLDDEYKKTLETDLPKRAVRFRSVLDIMVSDRVLFEILFRRFKEDGLEAQKVLRASQASLEALTRSGAQEASEEGGIHSLLLPEQVLFKVHHFKTGLLFQSPWAVPAQLEDLQEATVLPLLHALYQIGLGCQIMDDMVDLARDAGSKHHNYCASLLFYDSDRDSWDRLQSRISANPVGRADRDLLLEFPGVLKQARNAARGFLEKGLGDLLTANHHDLLEPAILFLSRRIGTENLMGPI